MATLGALRVVFKVDIRQFRAAMEEAESIASRVGKNLRDIGGRLTTRVTMPILGMGMAALKASTDFNAAMANVASLGDAAAQNIGAWKTEVQQLAIELGKSTGDLAAGLYQVVSAFGASAESTQILEINARAAAAGLAKTSEAINLTSAVTKAYGDTSAEAVRKVADLALKTVQLGQTTFPELAASIGRVTPLASSLGIQMEELFAVLATATGVTGSAAEVNTQMRAAMQALMAPTADMAGLLQKLGYESGQAMIQELGFVGALQAIVKHAEETGTPLQKFIGSVEGMTLAMALSGGLADDYTEKLAAMGNAAGAMDEAFAQQTQGINKVGFALAQLKQMVLVTAQRLGDALAPAVLKLVDMVRPWLERLMEWVERFQELDERTQAIILGVVAFVAALGPVLVVVGTVVSAIGSIAGAIGGLAGAVATAVKWFGGLAGIGSKLAGVLSGGVTAIKGAVMSALGALGPFGWALLALAAVVIGLYLAWKNNWFGMREIINQAIGQMKAVWTDLVTYWTTVAWPAIQAFIVKMQETLGPALEELARVVRETLAFAVRWLAQMWEQHLWPAIQAGWNWVQVYLLPGLAWLAGVLVTEVGQAVEALAWVWKNILWPALQAVWALLDQIILPVLGALAHLLRAVVGKAVEALAGLWQNVLAPAIEVVVQWLVEHLQPVWEGIVAFIQEHFVPWLDNLSGAFAAIVDVVRKVVDWIHDLANAIENLELPGWLTPGSPTPWEIGLWGIYDALRKVGRVALPDFVAGVRLVPEGPPGLSMVTASAGGRPVTVNFYYSPAVSLGDEVEAEQVLAPWIEATMKRMKAEGML